MGSSMSEGFLEPITIKKNFLFLVKQSHPFEKIIMSKLNQDCIHGFIPCILLNI
jgi:hypothetical protein